MGGLLGPAASVWQPWPGRNPGRSGNTPAAAAARVIPRLFHRAAASLASLLPGRGDSQPPRRRDRVLDQALANLLREAEKARMTTS